jgi:BMFP domain-containing protein YqiC
VNGLLYVIDKLGETLASAEQALARAQEVNEILQARVTELEAEQQD